MTTTAEVVAGFEEMFSYRFTVNDEEYQEYMKRPGDPPPVVEEWRNRSGGNQRHRDNRFQDRPYRERGGRRNYSYNYRPDQQWPGRGWENNHNEYRQGQYYPRYGQHSYSSYRRPYRDY